MKQETDTNVENVLVGIAFKYDSDNDKLQVYYSTGNTANEHEILTFNNASTKTVATISLKNDSDDLLTGLNISSIASALGSDNADICYLAGTLTDQSFTIKESGIKFVAVTSHTSA